MQYDYIIVGAGSGGCSLASRLADNCPDATIALIEAGPHTDRNLLRQHAGRRGGGSPQQAQDQLRLRDRAATGARWPARLSATRPRLGRFERDQCDDLHARPSARLRRMGAVRLSTAGRGTDVLQYFRRSEGNERGADAWHGADGPLTVSDLRYRNPFSERFVQAAQEAGHRLNTDFNGAGSGRDWLLSGHAARRTPLQRGARVCL